MIWESVLPDLRYKQYPKNEAVLHHGDKASELWLILSGWVKLTRQTPDGKESVVGLCSDGDLFGEAALFRNANYPYFAEIISDKAELLAVPCEAILHMTTQDASLSASIMALLNERVAHARLQLEHMTTMSAAQRLGCFLLRLCRSQTKGRITLQIPVEKHVLATYLGMKPETLSRALQQLKGIHIETMGQAINVQSIEALKIFVCNSCSESGSGGCEAESTQRAG
jgi:CRP-like cAMP-binding protein